MSEVDSDLAEALGMKKPYGALINDVESGQSADLAGLMAGDVIIEFNNEEIKFSSDLPHVVGQLRPKTQAIAKVIRDGNEISMDFTLGELPTDKDSFVPAKSNKSKDPIGLKVAEIDRENPRMESLPDGVIVSRVSPNSPASGRIYRGDVITMLQYRGDKYEIFEVEDFTDAIKEFETGIRVAIHLNRNGSKFITSVKIN